MSSQKIVFTCSCFDLLHAGHVLMLQDAKNQGDYLIVGLQSDPTIDRPDTKNKPVQSLQERRIMIGAIKYIDEIVEYDTEAQLLELLVKIKPDVRVLGTDWKNKPFTGHELDIPIHWHERNHSWSTSDLRKRVAEAEKL